MKLVFNEMDFEQRLIKFTVQKNHTADMPTVILRMFLTKICTKAGMELKIDATNTTYTVHNYNSINDFLSITEALFLAAGVSEQLWNEYRASLSESTAPALSSHTPKLDAVCLAPIHNRRLSFFRKKELQQGLLPSALLGMQLSPISELETPETSQPKSPTVVYTPRVKSPTTSKRISALNKYEDAELMTHPLFKKVFWAFFPQSYEQWVLEFYFDLINFRQEVHHQQHTMIAEANMLLKCYINECAKKRMNQHLSVKTLDDISAAPIHSITRLLFLPLERETEQYIKAHILPKFKQSNQCSKLLPFITLDPQQLLKNRQQRYALDRHQKSCPEDKNESLLEQLNNASATPK